MSNHLPVPTRGLKLGRFPESVQDSDLIVRRLDIKKPKAYNAEVVYETNDYQLVNNSIKEIEDFGVKIPNHTIISEKLDSSYENFLQIEWIDGISLDDSPYLDKFLNEPIFVNKVLITILNLSEYLKFKIRNKQGIINDIFELRQFVYGKSKTDSEDQIYLVDIDFHYAEYSEDSSGYHMICLYNLLKCITTLFNSASEDDIYLNMPIITNLFENINQIMSYYPNIDEAEGITKNKIIMFTNSINQLSSSVGLDQAA